MKQRGNEGQGKQNRWGYAVLAAAALVGAGGVGFRTLDRYLGGPTDSVPFAAGTLARIPLEIGGWVGQDITVDERILRATDADDLVNRQYAGGSGTEVVGLYIALGVRARDLMPHRPEVCYPGAGWTLNSAEDIALPLPDGSALACRLLSFSQGGFDPREMVVVNYYIVDGEYSPDVSLLRSKAWSGSRGVRYVAQVHITGQTSGLRDIEAAKVSATTFATDSASAIRAVVTSPQEETPSGQSETALKDRKGSS